MPLPKRRHSKMRGRKRRTHWKVAVPNVGECPHCHSPRLQHHVCTSCGYYNGRQMIQPKEG